MVRNVSISLLCNVHTHTQHNFYDSKQRTTTTTMTMAKNVPRRLCAVLCI